MKIRYSLIAIACAALVGCMDKDWNDPNNSEAYGNPSIKETNVITISELKNNYANVIASQTDPYKQVENNIQIKGRITGNDIQGNIYNSICLEDATGGILINIAQGGLFGYLPVGQEIIVNLKDLFGGSYGQQAAIGTPFTNGKGQTSVSRMNRYLWNEHFNYAGSVDVSKVQPEVFDVSKISDAEYLRTHSGRLMTIKGVKFKGADGKKVFATAAEKEPRVGRFYQPTNSGAHQHLCRLCRPATSTRNGRHNRHLHSLSQHVANIVAYRKRCKEVKHEEFSAALAILVCLSTQPDLCG